jgi:Uma2 family endonuclease
MATVAPILLTPDDLLTITDRPMPELVDGELVEREVGQKSDSIAATILFFLIGFVRANKLGLVNGAQGSYQIFPDDPNKVRIPDVSYTRADRLPQSRPAKGHGRVAPDLVVEVVSPNDPYAAIEAKIKDYLGAAVALIWVVDPDAKSVQIVRSDRTGIRLYPGDTLDGEAVLPGFQVEVSALFD